MKQKLKFDEKYYPKKQYILYDARARSGDTDDAAVLDTSDTLPKRVPTDYGEGAIWAEVTRNDYRLSKGLPVYENEKLLWEIK